jgi:putative transcriptional regulator
MHIRPGQFLLSTPLLDDTFFEQTILVITEVNSDGCIGFIINQLHGRNLNELQEFRYGPAQPLYNGGPVESDMMYCLHSRPDVVANSFTICEGLATGGDFATIVSLLKAGKLSSQEVKCLIGYCGWDAGELEAEIAEGSWQLIEAPVAETFANDVQNMWQLWQSKYR